MRETAEAAESRIQELLRLIENTEERNASARAAAERWRQIALNLSIGSILAAQITQKEARKWNQLA